ncbi:MAG: NAD(P)-dependent oxidoreductase [Deltaproteobacteria bacterium]|nr:NAD(P)-dependent oxidoreductase [Deltaproteobacteria bacterium]
MKTLVTGATGFIGNQVVLELLKNGVAVVASSRDKEKARRLPWFSQVEYIPADLRETEADFFNYFGQPSRLIHLAWDRLDDFQDLYHIEVNVPLHFNFIKNLVVNGLNHVVVIGTCLEYGLQNGCLSEHLETKPVTAYGLAKDTLRKYLEQLFIKIPTSFQWIRPFYVYGQGQNHKSLIPQLEAAMAQGKTEFDMSSGEQLRDYLPVEKMAEYIVAIALQERIQGIINCGGGIPISIRKLAEDHVQKKGSDIRLNLGGLPAEEYEPLAFWGDTAKLKSILRIQK